MDIERRLERKRREQDAEPLYVTINPRDPRLHRFTKFDEERFRQDNFHLVITETVPPNTVQESRQRPDIPKRPRHKREPRKR